MDLNSIELINQLDLKLRAECGRVKDRIPYIAENGVYRADMRDKNLSWWTNGFWSGMLWQMYQATGNPLYRNTAEQTEAAFDLALEQYEGLHHDLGFMFLHTAVADYRLTGNPASRRRGLHAANLLAGRFNPAGNYIRAWNKNLPGWMIIDCMMNLPLLYWAAKEEEDPRFSHIADCHAAKAEEVLLRADGSCHHIAVFDPADGRVLEFPKGQGYASGSSWSRGQAWAIYGFALASLHSGKKEFLDAAKRAAHYFIANAALADYETLVDFRAPGQPVYLDTTAGACAACGMLQIADMVPEFERRLYLEHAERMLNVLVRFHCDFHPERDGMLQDGTGAYERADEMQVPLIYGDYFLTEGILRLHQKGFMIW